VALSSVDVISPAFEHMKEQLLRPFQLGQWVRLAVVGLLAGEMGMGGCNVPSGGGGSGSSGEQQFQEVGIDIVSLSGGLFYMVGIGLLILLALAVMVLFIYISSRMRFVLFDSVLEQECRVREFWSRRGTEAFRYFVFQILFALGTALAVLAIIGIPVLLAAAFGWLDSPRDHLLPLILGGIAVGLVFVAVMATVITIQVLAKDFVVPQMALENATVGEGWSRLWAMMKEEKGGYAGYLGMKLVLAIAAAVGLGILTIIVILILLIPVGGVGIVAVLVGRAAGLSWNPVTFAIVIVLGALVLLCLMFLAGLISVPATVFFPAYSMHFFAERYPALHAVLHPPPRDYDVKSPSPQP
jgi:hypothetical protein